MHVTLVNPPPKRIVESHDAPPYPHLGLAYLVAYLRSQGIASSVIDAKLERLNMSQVQQRLRLLKPDVLGVTAMTHDIFQAHAVAQAAKDTLGNTVTIIGGCHATVLPRQTLEEFRGFDMVVFGEGEQTLVELVRRLQTDGNLEAIKGLGYRDRGDIRLNEPRELHTNLDELPLPAWDLFPEVATYQIITARGCPFHCNFCMRVLGSRLRKRTPQNILSELREHMKRPRVRFIRFSDEIFPSDRRVAHELLDAMIQEGFARKFKWYTQTRANLVDYELFQKMKAAGCDCVAIGVESGNPQILKASKKGITLEQAAKAVELAKRAGLKTESLFIIGHPFETRQTVEDTINFAKKLNTTYYAFGIMVPYPGTEIYEMARKGEGGYKLISADWADFNKTIGNALELEELSREELEKLQLMAYFKAYLFNYKFWDFIKLFWTARRIVFAVIKKVLMSRWRWPIVRRGGHIGHSAKAGGNLRVTGKHDGKG